MLVFEAAVKGTDVGLELGYSHPINHPIPDGVTVTVADNVKIHVEGSDKQKVGQLAADIKSYYLLNPTREKAYAFWVNMSVEKKARNPHKTRLYFSNEFRKKARVITKAPLAY